MLTLFHVSTTYHLLQALTWRALHPADDAILLRYRFISSLAVREERLGAFFKRALWMPHLPKYDDDGGFHPESKAAYSRFLAESRLNLQRFDEIHVFGAHMAFGQFLAAASMPFVIHEEAAGMFSGSAAITDSLDKTPAGDRAHLEFCRRYGLHDGTYPHATRRVCRFAAQTGNLAELENLEDFDVVRELENLDPGTRTRIIRVFLDRDSLDEPVDESAAPPPPVLLFTQHFANLRMLSLDEQNLLYQLLVDYFFPGERIIFKPHPSDLGYYGILFPDQRTIREVFPAELLPFVLNERPKLLASVFSSAADSLDPSYAPRFDLNVRFGHDNGHRKLHRYALALRLALAIDPEVREIGTLGDFPPLLRRLADGSAFRRPDLVFRPRRPEPEPESAAKTGGDTDIIAFNDNDAADDDADSVDDAAPANAANEATDVTNAADEAEGAAGWNRPPRIVIVDDPAEVGDGPAEVAAFLDERAGEDDTVTIFLNSAGDFAFYSPGREDLWLDMIPVTLRVRPCRADDVCETEHEETIYVHAPREETRRMIRDFTDKLRLRYTGVDVEVERWSDDQLRCRVLEGLLEAMERRMLSLIEENRALPARKR